MKSPTRQFDILENKYVREGPREVEGMRLKPLGKVGFQHFHARPCISISRLASVGRKATKF